MMWDMHNHTTPEQVERNRMSLYANMNKRKRQALAAQHQSQQFQMLPMQT